MTIEDTQDLELLRAFRDATSDPTDLQRARARRALDETMKPARSARGRWFARVAVASLTIAVVAVALPVLTDEKPAAAAAFLKRTAAVAASRPDGATLDDGGYAYLRSSEAHLSSWDGPTGVLRTALVPRVREIWVARNGSGRIREVYGEPRFFTDADRRAWESGERHAVPEGSIADSDYPAGKLHAVDLSDAPTDTNELYEAIERRRIVDGPPGHAETFVLVGDLLRAPGVPSAVRAALFRVAARIPGVLLIGPTKDESGRAGVAVGYEDRGVRHELIFDPETSVLLGERTVVVNAKKAEVRGVTAGDLIAWATYESAGIVESPKHRPQR